MELILSEIRKNRTEFNMSVIDVKFEIYKYFLRTDQYIFFKRMRFAINNQKFLLKEYKFEKQQ